jgi:hypothetical protein
VWVPTLLCKLQKGCTQLAAANDKVYQLLAHGQLFTPGTLFSSTTMTKRKGQNAMQTVVAKYDLILFSFIVLNAT